jgi:protocatechuate 3,4-dioxygenase beta subunit
MERKDFLRFAGAAGLASMIPGASHAEGHDHDESPAPPPPPGTGCELIPSETPGPYPLDLSGDDTYFRTDIREDQPGVDHRFRLRIIGTDNCLGMPNLRVDAWHCNVDGYYSGYTTSAHLGSQDHNNDRFLRGIQMTDAFGEVEFLTRFPGWYPGRTCHIHFQVFLGSMVQVTSQFCYPTAEKNALLTTNAPYTTWGADPLGPEGDGIFADGYALQVATLTFNETTQEYESFLEVAINGTGTTGLQQLAPETGGQFTLGQNFPNPYVGGTTVPFTLKNTSDVKLELFDVTGRKVAVIARDNMPAGEQRLRIDLAELGLDNGNYVYQLNVSNFNGSFRQCKMMTAKK